MMKAKTSLHRPALAGIAAVGLTTTVLLAPAAHADTELERPEGSASTAVVADMEGAAGAAGGETAVEETGEAAAGTGDEVAVPTDDQATDGIGEEVASEAGDDLLVDAGQAPPEAEPAEAEPADETAGAGDPAQDGLCVDDAGAEQPAEAGSAEAGVVDAGITETGTSEAGIAEAETAEVGPAEGDLDVAAGLPDVGPASDGTVTDPECAATVPEQAGEEPDAQLPVGGVDAGRVEASSQGMVLPVATAGAAAAAIGLGAYTLVRRRRSGA